MPFDSLPQFGPDTEVLIAARGLLARRGGWSQHSFGDPERRTFCMLGAIRMALRGYPFSDIDTLHNGFETSGQKAAERRIVKRLTKVTVVPVPKWNDRPGRRKREVLQALDTAISLCPAL